MSRRWGLGVPLAAIVLTTGVLADGPQAAPGPATGRPQDGESPGPAATLVREFAGTRDKARANLDRREYSKLLDLLDEEDLGAERPFALLRACRLAAALGKWSAVLEHAAEIETLGARGLVRQQALLARARALAQGRGTARETLGVYLDLAREAKDRAAPLLLEALDTMVALGDVAAAGEALEQLEKLRPELEPYLTDRHLMLESLGKPAPALEARSADGEAFALAGLQGKTVLLVFWAAWDPASLDLLADLAGRAARSRHRLIVQGVCVEPGDLPAYATWAGRSRGVMRAPIMATGGFADPLARTFGVGAVPATRLIDPEGKLVGVDLGPDTLQIAIDRLLR